MADSLILGISLFLLIFAISALDISTPLLESSLIIGTIISVEPLFVALTGASIGHHIFGLRVRRVGEDRKLGLLRSYLRALVKLSLGLFSLVSVLSTRKHQGLHDLVSDSIVVHKDRNRVKPYEVLAERQSDADVYMYPSKVRRMSAIVIYYLLLCVALGIASVLFFSDDCLGLSKCSRAEVLFNLALSIASWGGIFLLTGLGWRGRLYGARRKNRNTKQLSQEH